ncbi:probable LRR receptor-like serine/threonine-protein kinase At1g67720 [Coffea eugenioides]|uniref:Leucine-rich repeat receptor-like serine/threonine-protein kinase At2g14510 n=1 Tax=Coffea arabica TaxID=13443 RepID=A0A6P6X0Z4_COFAR|nr:probable LRR receptor-like serine/threonine-protein kinase At1g67720 [Coffea arabica]XP_027165591.1 probable LRR receptor-like serine/threonine-protein kinase At1g67720 [Coffea eugenioides]
MKFLFPFLLLFLSLIPSLTFSESLRGTFIDCGATSPTVINGQQWVPDNDFITVGTPKNLSTQYEDLTLSTVRTFPVQNNIYKKFCYDIPAFRTGKYLVRTTYFYGGVNGNANPPVFDQVVDGTIWSIVNTTEDYGQKKASIYEGIFVAAGKAISVCLAANNYTDSDPFISALEVVVLANSLYNSTDFGTYGLKLVARHSFGYNGPLIRYPDDQFDRYWQPFGEDNSTTPSSRNVSVSGFWNIPPLKVFQTHLGTNQPEPLELPWPSTSLPNSIYYIALYFADDRVSPSASPRVFNITVNGIMYYANLAVTEAGEAVFANQWPLAGLTNITLTPATGSAIGPLINAGEVFEVLNLGGRTLTRDVIAMERIKASIKNPPLDWNGDPCLPRQYSWTGVSCSKGPKVRVTTLNLTNMGISGSISPNISSLSALSGILLGNNSLTGSIPNLSSLKRLEILHLEDNKLSGEIPSSLGNIQNLHELFLQNNNLTGTVPSNLVGKSGLNLKVSGNPFLPPPAS